jgi:hypothetical protein
MDEDNKAFDSSQFNAKSSVLDKQQQQLSANSKLLRRRTRRPKRSIGCPSGSIHLEDDDQWYDAQYQLLSSGCATHMDDNLPSQISQSIKPLPILLYERELYSRTGNARQYRRINSSWTLQMLSDTNDANQNDISLSKRAYCKQHLKFCNLRTSIFDAVLGIEPYGNYMVAIGTNYDDENHLLRLMLCGLPSCKNPTLSVAPLLMSIPLSEANLTSNYDSNTFAEYFLQIEPQRYPLRIWLSTDERIGACMYRTKLSRQTKSANVLLFPLPRAISVIGDDYIFYQLNYVHVPCQSKQDMSPIDDSNLLTRVSCFPNHKLLAAADSKKQWLCDTVTSGIIAYIFLIDVENGFRLTWIYESTWEECPNINITPIWNNSQTETESIVRASEKSRIVVPMSWDDSGWQPMHYNSKTGEYRVLACEHIAPTFKIAFSCFFSVNSLLLDILAHRPHLVSPRFCGSTANLPNFTYHLVHIHNDRVAEVLLVFAVGPIGRGCLGVFVEVDLFTQDYREMEWIKHPAHDSPPSTCAKLALDRRKSQSVSSSVHCKLGGSLLDLLYPSCVTMDNRAIRRHVPTTFLAARSAPVTISYT